MQGGSSAPFLLLFPEFFFLSSIFSNAFAQNSVPQKNNPHLKPFHPESKRTSVSNYRWVVSFPKERPIQMKQQARGDRNASRTSHVGVAIFLYLLGMPNRPTIFYSKPLRPMCLRLQKLSDFRRVTEYKRHILYNSLGGLGRRLTIKRINISVAKGINSHPECNELRFQFASQTRSGFATK